MLPRILTVLAFFLLLCARRHEQLTNPAVWDEDGAQVLPALIAHGAASLLAPVNGYLIAVPKLISFAALSVSFSYYPIVSTILAWAFIIAVACAIAMNRTMLRGGAILAAMTFLIPSDPEVFGLPLYTFWWASLLLFLTALWRPERDDLAWRLVFVVAGGLSSPVVLVVTPLLWLRAVLFRGRRIETIVAAAATLCGLVQAKIILESPSRGSLAENVHSLPLAVPKFFGDYLAGNFFDSQFFALTIAGTVMLGAIGAGVWSDRRNPVFWILGYLWIGTVALTLGAVDLAVLHPVLAGPRYFFFPFVLETWLLIQLVATGRPRAVRAATAAMLALSAVNALPSLSRAQDPLPWLASVRSCPDFAEYAMPVQYDGQAWNAWQFRIAGAQCAALARGDVLARFARPGAVYPYAAFDADLDHLPASSLAPASALVKNTWQGSDAGETVLPGFDVIGSRRTSDADQGNIVLRLRRGDGVLFRSGPSVEHQFVIVDGTERGRFLASVPVAAHWKILDFSNRLLPQAFTVTFLDAGSGWGEWSAVALRR